MLFRRHCSASSGNDATSLYKEFAGSASSAVRESSYSACTLPLLHIRPVVTRADGTHMEPQRKGYGITQGCERHNQSIVALLDLLNRSFRCYCCNIHSLLLNRENGRVDSKIISGNHP